MTLLKEKLDAAGVDTAAARLAALAVIALQKKGEFMQSAVDHLFHDLLKEPQVIKEALLRPYLIARQADMRGDGLVGITKENVPSKVVTPLAAPARPRRQPDPGRKQAIANIVDKAVKTILFKYVTSGGRDWATVGAHELAGMDRDGRLARAIQIRLGMLSNSQRFKPLGELMSPEKFNGVLKSLVSDETERARA